MTKSTAGRLGRYSQRKPHRGSIQRVLLSLIALATLIAIGYALLTRSQENTEVEPLLGEVIRGRYQHIVLEQGEVESSNNVEVVCKVKNRAGANSPATRILDVIPEGSMVQEGDWLVTFDSNALENELIQQTITAKTAETLVIQAKAAYDTAVMSKTEYIKGTFEQARKTNQNLIFVAEENLKKAELSFDSIKRSVSRGLISPLQLQGEEFRVNAARKELELAQQNLDVLENYTKEKMMTQLESDVASTKIQYENMEASYQEEMKKLEEIKSQIENCTVVAPQAGQVVYANVYSSRSSNEFVVEPGAVVRERQEIIRLPDPQQMQITANISETQINLVRKSMKAMIRVDALGDETLQGIVTKVNPYAEPGQWWSSNGKEYKVLIKIIDPPAKIRTGLTAEVRILIDSREDALQIPIQAVLEHKRKTFCLTKIPGGYATHEINFDSTNNKTIALDDTTSPLKVGDQVVLNPREYTELFDFSQFPGLQVDPEVSTDTREVNVESTPHSTTDTKSADRSSHQGDTSNDTAKS